jgi:hypothetical protein
VNGTVELNELKPMFRAAIVAAAALGVILIAPGYALAARDCAAANYDPTAAQYCNPTQNAVDPVAEESASKPKVAAVMGGEGSSSAVAEESASKPKVAAVMGGEGPSSGGGGSLPFTGADLLALVAVASAFLAIGLALRQLSSSRPGAD